jgi:glyoxylase-like metal-dependent hydrolase (beta-lactamase superfamily II)
MDLLLSKPHLMRIVSTLLFLAVGSMQLVRAQGTPNRGPQNAAPNASRPDATTKEQKAKGGELELLPVQGSVSMVAGAGGNIAVQAGRDGIVLVDTGLATMTDKALQLIRPLSKGQITYIINTDDRTDHVAGNENFAKLGRPLAIDRASGASVMIVAFNTVLDRMSAPTGQAPPTPEKGWPNDTYSTPQKNLYFNGEAIQVVHQPATTDGNSFVFFRRSDVISTGDIFDPTEYPVIDLKSGGSLQGILDGLYRLKQMAVPADHMEGGTMLIPGHGRICDVADLDVYQQMLSIVRDRLQDMIKRGMTLEQVKAAKPTRDYDPIYSSDTGSWTADMFVEAAYKSLTTKPDPKASHGTN